MQEWTDPRYATAVAGLMAKRTASLTDPSPRRCRACFGFRVQLVLGSDGARHELSCTKCGGSGLQPPRRRSRR
ncbi:hypothetical protein [Streptomyces sp. NPDC020951]|uniref:hypothetical protein n=1 Tax=Streptomyces sp. NPDC020951 TaxID=3365104 RepID=UPI0037A04F0A